MGAGHTLHYGQGVPQCKVPAILATLTGVQVTQGALRQDALRRAHGTVGQAYQDLRASLAQAERVHTDDTGWRVGGRPAQLMVFTTETETVYQIRNRHRNEEVREVIPADYAGTLLHGPRARAMTPRNCATSNSKSASAMCNAR